MPAQRVVMVTRRLSPRQAQGVLESGKFTCALRLCAPFSPTLTPVRCKAFPLFNPTATFHRHLELFAACEYRPTTYHPLVQAWLTEQGSISASSAILTSSSPSASSSADAKLPIPVDICFPRFSSPITQVPSTSMPSIAPQNMNLKSGFHAHSEGMPCECGGLLTSQLSISAPPAAVRSTPSSIVAPPMTVGGLSPPRSSSSSPPGYSRGRSPNRVPLDCHNRRGPISV